MPYIQVGRSDLEEHDVSEASNHLNERAEESKEKEKEKEKEQQTPATAQNTGTAATTTTAETASSGEKEEEGKEPDTQKQHSLIQAARTDDATWDVRHSARNGWCCPRFFKRVS